MHLGLSQPATSRALGLELTPRAEALAGPVSRLLDDARGIVAPAAFDPAHATGRVAIAAHDHLSLVVLAGLVARFERHAPRLSHHVAPPVGDNVGLIEQGVADLALGLFETIPGSLYTDDFVCLVHTAHPVLDEGLGLERYLALRHVAVTISGVGESAVDAALAARGHARRVALRVPHFLAGAMLVADSDMILTLPRRLARRLADKLPLALADLPLPVPPVAPAMLWHERVHGDPAHAWVRQQLVEVAAAFDPAG